MSKESRKTRTGRRQPPLKTTSRSGRRNLAEDSPETFTLSSGRHSEQVLDSESLEIQAQVQQMTLEAQRLGKIQAQYKRKPKTRSRENHDLDPITEDDHGDRQSSSEEEEEFEDNTNASKIGSSDTIAYSQQGTTKLSLLLTYPLRRSPDPLNSEAPPFMFNAQQPLLNAQPPLLAQSQAKATSPAQPNIAATPVDPMALIQSVLLSQAESNRQQAESNRQLQQILASSMDKQITQQARQIDQQATIFARQTLVDAKTSIKPMRDGVNICQYFEHLETELRDVKIPKTS